MLIKIKKYFNISSLLNFLTISAFGFLSLDSLFYFGFSQKHFFINSQYFLIFYIVLISFLFLSKKILISPNFKKINKFIFPIILLIAISINLLEIINYPNFVFTYLHINPINFLYLPILSGFIICIYNYVFLKNKLLHSISLIARYSLLIYKKLPFKEKYIYIQFFH